METTKDAYEDLLQYLKPNEWVEAIVFGDFGWSGYHEDFVPNPIPVEKRGVVLTLQEARPLMRGWSFDGGHGAPLCYAVRIWTNERVIWVTQYDGATSLDSAPRNPVAYIPDMPGG